MHIQVSYFEIYMDKIRDLLDSKCLLFVHYLFTGVQRYAKSDANGL